MRFQWDRNKNDLNIHKHGIDFEDAIDVCFDFHIIVVAEPSFGEVRELAIGIIAGREVTIVYAWRRYPNYFG